MPGSEMGCGQIWSEGDGWEKNREARKKTQTQPRHSQLQGLNLKHIFMGSWADGRADCSEKQWDLVLPSASLISLLAPCQQNGNILSLTLMTFFEHTKTTENYPVIWILLLLLF